MNRCILFHAVDGIGLGHLSRLSAIALAIREQDPNLLFLFAVEGDSHGLLESAQLPYVTFPAASRFDGGEGSWLRSIRGRLLGSMAGSIIEAIEPRLIVFDCLPNPAFLAVAGRRNTPFAICVRKFKDMDDYFKRFRLVLEQARIIIFPHDVTEIEVPPEFVEKSKFVGTIVRPLAGISAPANRGSQSQVVISGGGGGYPGTVDFYNLVLEALSKCRQTEPMLSATLVTGPLFQEWGQLKPASGVHIIPFDPEITLRFREARLVICQGGYNTIAELTALGVPVICVPAVRRFDDQHARARQKAEAHSQFYIWENSDSGALAAHLLKVLQMPPATPASTSDNYSSGASRAAEALIELM